MPIKYRLKKGTNKAMPSYDKWVPKVVHYNTITADQIAQEIEQNCSAKVADVELVLCELIDTIKRHLHEGDRVEVPHLGTFKMEIKGRCVENPEDFKAAEHIAGVNLHFLPFSKHGTQKLYEGVRLEKES